MKYLHISKAAYLRRPSRWGKFLAWLRIAKPVEPGILMGPSVTYNVGKNAAKRAKRAS